MLMNSRKLLRSIVLVVCVMAAISLSITAAWAARGTSRPAGSTGLATLTIIASSDVMVRGGAVPTITPTYLGLAAGTSGPAGPPKCEADASSSSPIGTYQTFCVGAQDSNYNIQYVTGELHVVGLKTKVVFLRKGKPVGISLDMPASAQSFDSGWNGTSSCAGGNLTPKITNSIVVNGNQEEKWFAPCPSDAKSSVARRNLYDINDMGWRYSGFAAYYCYTYTNRYGVVSYYSCTGPYFWWWWWIRAIQTANIQAVAQAHYISNSSTPITQAGWVENGQYVALPAAQLKKIEAKKATGVSIDYTITSLSE